MSIVDFSAKDLFGEKPVCLQDVLCVDPGHGGTGWAMFRECSRPRTRKLPPCNTGVLGSPDDTVSIRGYRVLAEKFRYVLMKTEPQMVVLEVPELWSSSSKSQASAKTGSLFKLSFLCGCYMQVIFDYDLKRVGLANTLSDFDDGVISVILTVPQQWKGQLKKPAVIKRIGRALGRGWMQKVRDHEADAVGMGLAIQGGI